MTLNELLSALNDAPETVQFTDVMAVIDESYNFEPTEFSNGDAVNAAGENNGSCKVFAFGQLQDLSESATLACFGEYYRKDVLENPEGTDHQNIRNFMKTGWQGIEFKGTALTAK